MSRRLLLLPLVLFVCSSSPALADEPSPPGTDLYNDAPGPFAGQADISDLVTTTFTGVQESLSAQQVTISGQLVDQYQTPVADVALTATYGTSTVDMSSDGNGSFSATLPNSGSQTMTLSYGGDDEYAPSTYQIVPPSPPPPPHSPSPPPLPLPPPASLGTLTVSGRVVRGQLTQHKQTLVRICVANRRHHWRTVVVLRTSKRGSFTWRASHRIHGAVRFSIPSPRVSTVIYLL